MPLLFKVSQRDVRERFTLLQNKLKKKNAADERSSGTSATPTETDVLIEEITDKEKDMEESGLQGKKTQTDRAEGTTQMLHHC